MLENVVLITGAAQRVGLAAAKQLAQSDYPVVITYRTYKSGVDELKKLGVTCVQADFSTTGGIDAFNAWVKKHVSSLRAVVHNASAWQAENKSQISADILRKMYQIHVETPYLINLTLEPLLKAGNQLADIIHITDYTVEKGSDKHIAYCASKAALDNLTLSFAKRFAPEIKVNTIAPSLIVFNPEDDPEYREKTLKKSALGVEPGEQEVVNAIEFILNSGYMTGRQLKLDGGRHLI
ncbi:dihydromonapterin reductase [Catenovulum sediminis]|uniref:Dihydromonapterin reductase n=1 Tax=Catenovulum sediminis TaxID=1740262 RepID=A0ABV1RC16_9ALTE|nr:dihydromonapterin reductase [Catenovulum sediminis]